MAHAGRQKDVETCRLCLEHRQLCRSHIVPEFLYRPLYDSKHRVLKLDSGTVGKSQIQKGLRDYLLCSDCEQHLSKIEKYFAEVWYNPPKLPSTVEDLAVSVSGLDYALFKLFHLSILWRASVSSLRQFQRTKLGPHEEKLRRMIQALEPGPPHEYAIFGAVMTGPASKELAAPTIMSPIWHRVSGVNLYLLAFGSCAWQIHISGHRRLLSQEFALSESGTVTLLTIDMTEYGPIDKFMRAKALEARNAPAAKTRRKPAPR